tara:strand:- start:1483 stop:1866 length:384 start_codon:yes stop_codon:yes gene_type:complete
MTEEEKEEVKAEMWTMEDLVALTDEVQEAEIKFREKNVKFQFCELVEKEEPKFRPISDRASEEEKMAYYTEIGGNRILAMLEKANEKNPDGACIDKENWALLPTTLRYQISNEIMGIEQESRENFPI